MSTVEKLIIEEPVIETVVEKKKTVKKSKRKNKKSNSKEIIEEEKPLLKEDGIYFGRNASFVAPILEKYWEAIREVCPQPFENPEGHVMLKTTGVVTLHSILPRILRTIGFDSPSKNDFVKILQKRKYTIEKYLPSIIRQLVANNILYKKTKKPEMTEEGKLKLIEYFREDVQKLETLLGRKLPWPNFC